LKYLLDTCIISELIKLSPSESVIEWINNIPEDNLYLSVVTIGEIQKGITKLADSKKKLNLQSWLDNDLFNRFSTKIISLDKDICLTWGIITANAEKRGKKLASIDSLIAATAIKMNLTLVTRNTSDMIESGANILDPFIS
jgi:predicted nucleic acid-binding protein